jgi:hypothetical protein
LSGKNFRVVRKRPAGWTRQTFPNGSVSHLSEEKNMTESNEICNPVVAIREVEESENHMKFVDLASKRTTNVLHSMGVLQKCLDKHTYDYSKDQTHKIFKSMWGSI